MKFSPKYLLAIFLTLSISGLSFAATVHVPGEASTVQAGIDLAAAGDTVLVDPGTFHETIEFNGLDIVVMGSGSSTTTVFGNGNDPAVRFAQGETSSAVFSDFAVTGGNSGIVCENGSNPTISNCTLSMNFADEYGGGIQCIESSPTISGCALTLNSASRDGGGLYSYNGSPAILDSSIDDNIAPRGAGVFAFGISTPLIYTCTIAENSATWGGGLLVMSGANLSLIESTVTSNQSADAGGGLYLQSASARLESSEISLNTTQTDGGGVFTRPGSTLDAVNCIVNDNDAVGSGGGLYIWNSTFTLTNSIVARNTSGFRGGGVHSTGSVSTLLNCSIADNAAATEGGGLYAAWFEPVAITNSIFWGNGPEQIFNHQAFPAALTVDYSDVQGGWAGVDNMDADPRFRNYGKYEFILAPISPCIDAATGDDDGLDWCTLHAVYCQFNSQAPDLGAYGGPAMAGWLD